MLTFHKKLIRSYTVGLLRVHLINRTYLRINSEWKKTALREDANTAHWP